MTWLHINQGNENSMSVYMFVRRIVQTLCTTSGLQTTLLYPTVTHTESRCTECTHLGPSNSCTNLSLFLKHCSDVIVVNTSGSIRSELGNTDVCQTAANQKQAMRTSVKQQPIRNRQCESLFHSSQSETGNTNYGRLSNSSQSETFM